MSRRQQLNELHRDVSVAMTKSSKIEVGVQSKMQVLELLVVDMMETRSGLPTDVAAFLISTIYKNHCPLTTVPYEFSPRCCCNKPPETIKIVSMVGLWCSKILIAMCELSLLEFSYDFARFEWLRRQCQLRAGFATEAFRQDWFLRTFLAIHWQVRDRWQDIYQHDHPVRSWFRSMESRKLILFKYLHSKKCITPSMQISRSTQTCSVFLRRFIGLFFSTQE